MHHSAHRLVLYAILLMLCTPLPAFAEDEPSSWPEGSAMHTGLIWKNKHDYFLKLLQKHHAELIHTASAIPDNNIVVNALSEQHQKWLEYYEAECTLIGNLTGAGGSWPSTYTMQCQANLIDKRFRRVSSALRCIQKISEEKRQFEQQRCFYQLAPLAWHE